ncbi:uncharacterized protein PHACADRAFT_250974 [Phanerochaete carnosa HHB-10118-sp]|uniref:Uncharacterized protein n=1 Tax=Phanerochaete carnosa (strain HHB-10118-sp) TaxID=650164 RepID=K5WLM1_PHACS|nr:uncharacterized protein PHACADRAFT_250974 [Phanerochaete carnosa HHB-10118-sp]EKM60089.1 hypothetical protein PHACADRAFT_250974 [Phanerochaete carnosa HHB-10118-sp]
MSLRLDLSWCLCQTRIGLASQAYALASGTLLRNTPIPAANDACDAPLRDAARRRGDAFTSHTVIHEMFSLPSFGLLFASYAFLCLL